ncbi:unnamed protein product [Rotaria sordida]|uniref:Uncharacterized protein n=1 Tax=Rotaria sordida TaxID=392033 RepID=A0A815KMM9_9BILA|nr:unnamed protein product [Rotaria sordida]CAF1622023.1 unnamed protein product [Rotaria sordida]
MMNFDNLFRRFILTQSFVRGWGNPFHLQEIFTYRHEKIGLRDECLELKQKGNQNYLNVRFRLPLANYLPHLVSSQVATAHFQHVLSRDHRFGIDSIPIGICYAGTGDHGFSRRRLFTAVPLINQYPIGSILLENPYYGLRKPPDQSRSSLLWSDPPSRQFYKNKASQTFYDYLCERNRSIDSNKIVLNLIKDMMHLLMDEFTSLYNYSCSVQSNISNAMFIACTHDGYVLRDGIPHMNDVWPGIHIRYIPHGHVSAFLFNQSGFHHAAAEMLQRQEPNVKLKKHLIVSPISVTTPKNS